MKVWQFDLGKKKKKKNILHESRQTLKTLFSQLFNTKIEKMYTKSWEITIFNPKMLLGQI